MIADPLYWPEAKPVLTVSEMRAAEQAALTADVSLRTLMERAGAALADLLWRVAAGRDILFAVGPGNNGGDAYVAARLLAGRGATVRIAALAAPSTVLCRAVAADWTDAVEPLDAETPPAAILVDALFGTGLSRAPAARAFAALQRLADAAQRVVAVDLPSGLDGDSGRALGEVIKVDLTVALGALKPAHVLLPGAVLCGETWHVPIGVTCVAKLATLGMPRLAGPDASAHKYTRGMVAVVAGAMSGAAELAARAALRSGAGFVTLYGGKLPAGPPFAIVRRRLPKAGAWDARIGAIVIGPGLGSDERARDVMASAQASGFALVVDADALALFDVARQTAPAILTPHAREFARLMPGATGTKIEQTRALAERTGAVVIHKGADTIIAAPDGRAVAAWPGCSWLASAGTGDVLSGICGAMLARGQPAFEAACAAVALHIAAARRAGPGLIADDLTNGPIA